MKPRYWNSSLLVISLCVWISPILILGQQTDCKTAWECCIHDPSSDAFNRCCTDHGCCPDCGNLKLDGCCYNNVTYKFGSVVEQHPEVCVQFVCAAERLIRPPYIKTVIHPVFYDPGPANPRCVGNQNTKCIDNHGILRSQGEEWYRSETCEACLCLGGIITCRGVKRPCPGPPRPDCRPKPGGCCPLFDCGIIKVGCTSSDGTHKYEETWWDKKNPCIYNKCTEKGVLQYKKNCPKVPPPPNPTCRLVKSENECCEKWKCGPVCPDPKSFGRVCVRYFDQCKSNRDCTAGNSCCLVDGCGHECMNLQCPDPFSYGRYCFLYNDQCTSDKECKSGESCCLVAGCGRECINLSAPVVETTGRSISPNLAEEDLPKEDPLVQSPQKTLAHCLSSTTNLTKLIEDLTALNRLSDTWPFKSPDFYLMGFQQIVRNRASHELLPVDDMEKIQSFAAKFNWNAIIPLLSTNTTKQELSALAAGNTNLQIKNVVTQAIANRNDSLDPDSPSAKHQVAFRRTDPIATNMAQLGAVIETATSQFVQSFNIPPAATNALPILGEVSDCARRFQQFLRPILSPPCDPTSPFRSLDGTCNNLFNNLWGAAFTKFRRILPARYGDGISSLRSASDGGELPSPRLISSKVNTKPSEESSTLALLHVTYAQFLDHDLTATPIAKGYLGGSIKCCDDLRDQLDFAFNNLKQTQQVIQQIKLTEPSLTTNKTLGELAVTLQGLTNLKENGETLFTNSTNTRLSLQISQQLDIVSRISIPIRPLNGECAPIAIPADDPFYSCYGKTCMEFVRSAPAPSCTFGPREQLNQHTAYLDGSAIYGVKQETTNSLRTFTDGLLKYQLTKDNEELLVAEDNANDGCNVKEKFDIGMFCFKAGDGRVNEQIMLSLIQTVWAREHNRVARILKSFNNSGWDDERLFQETRRIVVAELQQVTYKEFLPNLLGSVMMNVLSLNPLVADQFTEDYDASLDASIANAFATAAYRYGHSQISDYIQKVNKHGSIRTENLSKMFFNPFPLYEKNTLDDLTRGSTSHPAKKVDAYFTEEVTGKLFRGKLPYGLDLVALNLQRGRDHGLPSYTEWKEKCGFPATTFNDLTSVMDEDIVRRLQEVYRKVEDIDLFIGAIAERPFLDGILGPTFSCIVADQFLRIKKGDRFWYEYRNGPGAFNPDQLRQLHKVSFARILCNNIPELSNIQLDPFRGLGISNPKLSCFSNGIPSYTLSPWRA